MSIDLKELTPNELASLKAKVNDEAAKRLGHTSEVVFRCPGDEREDCDFVSPTLAGVCPTHRVHVA